jgi:phosphoglycerate dehydrogenase-like enzyme
LEKAIPDLNAAYPGVEFVHAATLPNIVAQIADADVYLGWLNREMFLAAKNLRWIQSSSSGVNHYLAIPELAASDVLLTSASGTHAIALAESTLAMILAFTRQIRTFVQQQAEHRWKESRARMRELTGSVMGIVGFGAVGRALAPRAAAFEMQVLAVDVVPVNKPDCVQELWSIERLPDLLRRSDFVVVTVPYTPDTDGMIGAAQIAQMKPGALLVGISRGRIIDEAALVEALRDGSLSAAALDVFAQEPLPADSELWDIENLLITPHAAGGTQFEGQYILEIFRENLERFLQGVTPLRNQVDKRRGF